MKQGAPTFILLVCLLTGLSAPTWALDPVMQQTQRTLGLLGYDPGAADGVYGEQTRQALQNFQRDHGLPASGKLDAATLRALDQAITLTTEDEAVGPRPHETPLQIVLHYLRLYDHQPARVLPYVTAGFLEGMSPQAWIDHTRTRLAEQRFAYQTWEVKRLEVAGDLATVHVHTRVRLHDQHLERQEIFTVVQTPEDGWFIDTWRTTPLSLDEAAPPQRAAPRLGS